MALARAMPSPLPKGTAICPAAVSRDGARCLQLDRAADEAGERARVGRGVLVEEAVARAALHVVVERVEAACAERRYWPGPQRDLPTRQATQRLGDWRAAAGGEEEGRGSSRHLVLRLGVGFGVRDGCGRGMGANSCVWRHRLKRGPLCFQRGALSQ